MPFARSGNLRWVPLVLFLSFRLCYVLSLDNGVGVLPPLGFNTWNDFRFVDGLKSATAVLMSARCDVSEAKVKLATEALVSSGLAELVGGDGSAMHSHMYRVISM